MITNDEARARVQRGAAHLDQVRPGWFNRIDVGTLTLHDPCGCIVGQLAGGTGGAFTTEWHDLFGRRGGEEQGVFATVLYGIETAQEAYAPLQDAWIDAIADRRLSTAVEVRPAVDAVGLSVVEPVAVHAR